MYKLYKHDRCISFYAKRSLLDKFTQACQLIDYAYVFLCQTGRGMHKEARQDIS